MPQNSSMKTTKEIASGQRFRFFLKNGCRQPMTVNALNFGNTTGAAMVAGVGTTVNDDLVLQFKRAPNGRNAVAMLIIGSTGSADMSATIPFTVSTGTFTLTVNGVTTAPISVGTSANSYATTATAIAAALNALATDNPRAVTGGFNVVAGVGSANVKYTTGIAAATTSDSAIAFRIEFCGAYGKQPVTISCALSGLTPNGAAAGAITAKFMPTLGQVGVAPGTADANSLYEVVYPDGYTSTAWNSTTAANGCGTADTAGAHVAPKANVTFSFGQGGGGTGTPVSNLLGPYVDIICNGGRGQLEIGIGPDDINEIVM